MTASNFDRSLALVLKDEGGYVDHPADPGGATKYGITIGTLRQWRGKPVTKADVKALTVAEASQIYRRNYWAPIRGDDLPTGLDYAVFDFAVNSGIGRAAEFLQACLAVTTDGRIGDNTVRAAKAATAAVVVDELCDRRLAWLKRLKTWPIFGKGWTRRVEGVRKAGIGMAGEPVQAVFPAPQKPVEPPVAVPAPKPAPVPTSPPASPGGGWVEALLRIIAALFGKK